MELPHTSSAKAEITLKCLPNAQPIGSNNTVGNLQAGPDPALVNVGFISPPDLIEQRQPALLVVSPHAA